MKTNPMRFLITEDHATTRLGIKQILKENFREVSLGEASDASTTLQQLANGQWDLLVLDINLPDSDGLSLLQRVKADWPSLPVLIFSVHREDQFAMHALKMGAAGYLSKERAPEELADAVRTTLAGRKYVSSRLLEQFAGKLPRQGHTLPHEGLSTREFEVFRFLAAGKSGKWMAGQMGLSQKTVSTYRSRLLKKMNLGTTAELIEYAIRNRLAALFERGL